MALTYSNVRQGVTSSGRRFVAADVTFDNSYAANGEPVTLADLGLRECRRIETLAAGTIEPDGATPGTTTHGRQIVGDVSDPQNPKLKVYTANNTEAGAASDQSQIVQRVRFIGS